MRLALASLLLLGCSPSRAPSAVPDLVQELRELPDSSVAMEGAWRAERARLPERYDAVMGVRFGPIVSGNIVEMFEDRVAIEWDERSPLPREGGSLLAYDKTGYKADVFVVRVSGRHALGQVDVGRAQARVERGDRVCDAL